MQEKIDFDDRASRYLWVGIGCQRGVSMLAIERAIEWIFTEYDLDLATIVGIATLDRKVDEIGLQDYCLAAGLFLKTFSPERLNSVSGTHKSAMVAALVGTSNVAESAAMCAAQTDTLLVSKQKFQLEPDSGWITIAIAIEGIGIRD
jgi:cobalamin biosynthesis protein CbiG